MKRKLLMFMLLGVAVFFTAMGSVKANPITFSEVPLFSTDPSISGVKFFAGDPTFFSDTFVDDLAVPGDPYLLSGFDDDPASPTGGFVYDTFIGATSLGGFLADTVVTFDIAADILPIDPTKFNVAAVSGGAIVATADTGAVTDAAYHSLSVSHTAAFDSVWIWGEPGIFGFAEFFRIDNFGWEVPDDGGGPGGDPIPEPTTVLLLGIGIGGLGLTALRRKRREKKCCEKNS